MVSFSSTDGSVRRSAWQTNFPSPRGDKNAFAFWIEWSSIQSQ